ncbi:MAG: signal peptidase I [Oscillospiraceae bacterium]|nr:signal peptidase I [Oscillospiraceae bacterium]
MTHKANLAETPPVRHQGLYLWMKSAVSIFLAFVLVLALGAQPIAVIGDSMNPTLLDGDQVIVRSIFYTPRRGDVIVFVRYAVQDGTPLVKRVIALAGDVVDINAATGTVYVNGTAIDEPYSSEHTTQAGNISYPFTVPPGYVFVLGDNRSPYGSLDSRHTMLGPVDEREIVGGVIAVASPLERARLMVR